MNIAKAMCERRGLDLEIGTYALAQLQPSHQRSAKRKSFVWKGKDGGWDG